MRLLRLVVLTAFLPVASFAQDAQTLADIRAEIARLQADFNSLKSELVSSGAAASGAGGGDALQRMDAIEAALMRLTAKTEEVELKVNRVVADGTNRIGDLEFRLCEMEEGCDIGALGQTAPLGGGAVTPAPADPAAGGVAGGATGGAAGGAIAGGTAGPELALSEQADFDRAKEVLGQGDFRSAENLLAAHAAAWPNGPLTGEVLFLRGEALEGLGDIAMAARSYLDSFSGYPDGPRGAESLFRLGRALGRLGQVQEACVTLGQVGVRYPGNPAVTEAEAERLALSCP